MTNYFDAGIFEFDRLTPVRIEQIAKDIRYRPVAKDFAEKTVARLSSVIPLHGNVRGEQIEAAFLMATEVRKIFKTANLDIWEFFPRPPELSLLGYVFISAVNGLSLGHIIRELEARPGVKQGDGFLFDATAFSKSERKNMLIADYARA
jgi:hypothetical protein